MGSPNQIACLHTLASNVAVFDAVAAELGIAVKHVIREDLLNDAEAAGGLTDDIVERTADAIAEAANNAAAVALTCSTVGPGVDRACARGIEQAVRVDAALAAAVGGARGNAVVLYANPATLEPTRELFDNAAGADVQLDYRLAADAWDRFRAGDIDDYLSRIAAAADGAFAEGVSTVAFAQASMAGATALCRGGKPLTSPHVGLAAAVKLARGQA